MKDKLYLAGSLFNEAEVNQRITEGKMLDGLNKYSIYNPITAPCNDKEGNMPTSSDIFWGDVKEVLDSKIVVADISNQCDLGVSAELGIMWACCYLHRLAKSGKSLEEILDIMKDKKLVAHLSDIRKSTAHKYQGNNIPWGYNQFVIGLIEDIGVIKDNFSEAFREVF